MTLEEADMLCSKTMDDREDSIHALLDARWWEWPWAIHCLRHNDIRHGNACCVWGEMKDAIAEQEQRDTI